MLSVAQQGRHLLDPPARAARRRGSGRCRIKVKVVKSPADGLPGASLRCSIVVMRSRIGGSVWRFFISNEVAMFGVFAIPAIIWPQYLL
jgi:hypothetical protein